MAIPKVTILMGTWNRATMLDRAITSLQQQTFSDWELIIADDGSKDDTPAVIERWKGKEPRLVSLRSPVNQGISRNYNMGLRAARGEYVAMIDDDDPWCDDRKLEKQVKFLDEHPDYVGCGGGMIVVDGEGKERYRYLKPESDADIRARMLYSNPMANSSTMFRRAAGEAVGWYDETMRYSGDRDFFLKLGLKGKLYNFPEYFSFYTMSGHNTSIANIRPHLKASLSIMRRYRRNYPGYPSAWLLNATQYAYAFLPASVREPLHSLLARAKRTVFG